MVKKAAVKKKEPPRFVLVYLAEMSRHNTKAEAEVALNDLDADDGTLMIVELPSPKKGK